MLENQWIITFSKVFCIIILFLNIFIQNWSIFWSFNLQTAIFSIILILFINFVVGFNLYLILFIIRSFHLFFWITRSFLKIILFFNFTGSNVLNSYAIKNGLTSSIKYNDSKNKVNYCRLRFYIKIRIWRIIWD